MSPLQPSDAAARQAALDPTRSFLVQAPAGSGKTELLTDRILALLATVQRPEEIVAITFTRKAAAEMHARVMAKLVAAQGPEPASANGRQSWQLARAALACDARLGWQLLAHPGRLAIQTIDSFCASLVRRMPYLSQLGGMPGTVDDAWPYYTAAARATLALADDASYGAPVRALLAHLDVNLTATEQLLAQMLASRDQWLPLLGGAEREMLEANLAAVVGEALQSLARAMPLGWLHELPPLARAAAQCLEPDAPGVLTPLLDWHGPLPATPEALPQWRALAQLLLTASGGLRRQLTRQIGFPAQCAHKAPMLEWLGRHLPDADWIARLAEVAELPPAHYNDAQWRILEALLSTLRLAAAQLQLAFAAASEVDFIEIAQRALAALGEADDPSELLLRLDARIRHLLIDEFQDTSQPQIALLEKLTAGWGQTGQGGQDGHTLFLVGDPMQSIYRFRKAEVGLFLAARDTGVGEIVPDFLALTDNFRSQAGVVEWVNTAFARLFPGQDDAERSAIAYARSVAFNPALPGAAVAFHPVWRAEGARPAEPEEDIVLRLVRQAQAEGARSIAVLVRARGHAHAIARRLAGAGVPHRAIDLTPLAQRPVVADLVQLARALAHPGDRLAWLCVLRAPWCGLTLHSLTLLLGHDHDTSVPALLAYAPRLAMLAPQERERAERAAAILLDDGNASGAWPFAAWVERVWRRLGGDLIYADARDTADAEAFLRLLETLAPYRVPDPAALDEALARLYAAPDPKADGVEIMTMHKSKGLQFDVVILPGLHRRGAADRAPLVRFEALRGAAGVRLLMGPIKRLVDAGADPVSRYLGLREARRAAFETDRLLYVAATRARHRLHLVGEVSVGEDGEPRKAAAGTLLGRLWPLLMPLQAPPRLDAAMPAGTAVLRGPPLLRAALADLPPAAAAPLPPRLPGTPDWSQQRLEAQAGIVAHAWLEQLGRMGPAGWDAARLTAALPRIERQLSRAGVAGDELPAAARVVFDTLLATLADERGRWLLTQPAQREWRLFDQDGGQQVIDLALHTGTGWLVVDYKTGLPHPGETPARFAERMLQRHRGQLAGYAAAVAALSGLPAAAALYFPRAGLWLDVPSQE
ncbi:UvrD-helicase domain-containing protein [Chitiniphilus purpureus]|uniref:DNA 3'-5' helicase n=1 Tax=Chitiniphilus purpureus TaxID=2981137 RepID=A0ABY6DJ57_9NEIS|nr:UvrD-helicase domain-containing protein [Chitiniphilus sp. CD1]UXY14072.1 UvrD-helicase domain-containing protein [Chitiniphilus sp. CD1]